MNHPKNETVLPLCDDVFEVDRCTATQVVMTNGERYSMPLTEGDSIKLRGGSDIAYPVTPEIEAEIKAKRDGSEAWGLLCQIERFMIGNPERRHELLGTLRAASIRMEHDPAEMSIPNHATPKGARIVMVESFTQEPWGAGALEETEPDDDSATVRVEHPEQVDGHTWVTVPFRDARVVK